MTRMAFLGILVVTFLAGLFVGNLVFSSEPVDSNLELEMASKDGQIESLKIQRDEALAAVEPKDQEIADLREQLAAAPVEEPAMAEQEIAAEHADESEALVALEAQVAELTAQVATAQDDLTVAQAQRDEAKQALDAMLAADDSGAQNDALTAAQQALVDAENQAAETLAAVQSEAAEALASAQAEAEERLAAVTADLEASKATVEGLEEQLAVAETKIAELETTIDDLRNAPPVQLVIDGVANSVGQ